MIVAYLRVSTGKQHLKNQQDEIRRFTEKQGLCVGRWVTEIVSGRKNEHERKLGPLLRKMQKGDTLIVTELSRLSRTLTEIMTIMGDCLKRKVMIYSTKDGYAFDDSINSKVLCFAFGLVAEIERNLISMRTKEALALRKAEGVILGRRKGSCIKQKILTKHKQEIIQHIEQGNTIGSVCSLYGISRDTFHTFRQHNDDVDHICARNQYKLPASQMNAITKKASDLSNNAQCLQ